jgi:hypothetical protein
LLREREDAMGREAEASTRLGRVLSMFPAKKHELLRLSLKDPVFRSLCEDLCDAHDSLGRFLSLSKAGERPEVAEYRAIITELEAEVRAYVAANSP